MRLVTFLALIIINSTSFAQVGDPFPAMETEKLDDTAFSIPKDTNGKFSLLGLAYSKRSEKDLETWFSPVYNKFMRDSKDAGLFSSFGYDVNVYFIPMFTGIKAAGTGVAKKAAVKHLDPLLHKHILFYKGVLKPYKEALDFEKKDVPYFFVVNKEGKIVYATSGKFSESKMHEIEYLVQE